MPNTTHGRTFAQSTGFAAHATRLMAAAALVVFAGCAQSSPNAYTLPFEPPPRGAAGTMTDDPVRDELREILLPCARSLTELEDRGVSRRRLRRILTTLLSVAAAFAANEQGGGNSASGQPWRADRCTGPTVGTGCSATAGMGVSGGVADSLEDSGEEDLVLPARSVREALDAIDRLLWDTPDSSDWEHHQWQAWDGGRDALRRACGAANAVAREQTPPTEERTPTSLHLRSEDADEGTWQSPEVDAPAELWLPSDSPLRAPEE